MPKDGFAEVQQHRQTALKQINNTPVTGAQEAAKAAYLERINSDFDLIEELVIERGSVGAIYIPDAFATIVNWQEEFHDGNLRKKRFSTARYDFDIHFATS